MNRRWRWIFGGGAVALLVAGLFAWRSWSTTPPPELLTAPVERTRVVSTVIATGTLNALKTVLVGTYVSGPITEIDVDFNSRVARGQRVAKIDPRPFVVKVKQAQAQLATAKARVARAQADLQLQTARLRRQQSLREQKVVSREELDAAQSTYEQAVAQLAVEEASVEQAQASLDEAKVNLEFTDIVSPVDGVVLSRNVDVGQTVAAAFQTPTLFVIAEDLTEMQVTASVSESDIGPMHEGLAAHFSVDAYPDRTFEGVVSQVRSAPISVQNVVTYEVVIDVDNRDGTLRPGMTADVTIVTAEKESVLAVPARALRFRPDEAEDLPSLAAGRGRLWKVRGERDLVPVDVELGLRGETSVEILGGDVDSRDRVALGYVRAEHGSARAPRHP